MQRVKSCQLKNCIMIVLTEIIVEVSEVGCHMMSNVV